MAFVARAERKLKLQAGNTEVGPGAYIGLSNYKKSTNFAPFSTSADRSTDKSVYTPGPGSYLELFPKQKTRYIPGHSSAFASHSSRFEDKPKEVPGPGSYDVQKNWSPKKAQNKAESNTNWVRLPSAPSIPGLGYGYDETPAGELIIHKGPNVFKGDIKDSVGPGHYNPKYFTSAKVIRWRKTASNRDTFIQPSKSPGPGSYGAVAKGPRYKSNPTSVFVSNSKRATDISAELKESSSIPGPGKYLNTETFSNNPNPFSPQNFGSNCERFNSLSPETNHLGPGCYNIQDSINRPKNPESKAPFCTTDTRFNQKNSPSPGPGTYHGDEYQKKVWGKLGAFGCTEKRFSDPKTDIPGPGTYSVEPKVGIHSSLFNKGSSVFISRSKRIADNLSIKDIPPPGYYEVLEPIGKVKNEAKTHLNLKEETTKIAFNAQSERFINNKKSALPGPGTYSVLNSSPGRSIITSKETRFKSARKDVLGPGCYEEQETWNKKSFNALFDKSK